MALVGTCRDVTAERKREETLTLFEDVVHNVQIGLVVLLVGDPADGESVRLISFNPAAEAIARRSLSRRSKRRDPRPSPCDGRRALTPLVLDVARDGIVREGAVARSGDARDPNRAGARIKAFPLPSSCVGLALEDVSEQTRSRRMRDSEAKILEMIVAGEGLGEVLRALALTVERELPGCAPSIVLLEPDGARLRHGAENEEPEFVPSSFLILASDGHPLGALEVRIDVDRANGWQQEILTRATRLAGIAIERRQLEEQLRDLSQHVESVREEERTGIAREIHDELGQGLTALKMDIAWLGRRAGDNAALTSPAVREHLLGMSKLTDDIIQQVRRISAELRPGVLDDLGLLGRDRMAGAGVLPTHRDRVHDSIEHAGRPLRSEVVDGALPHPPGGAHERRPSRARDERRGHARARGGTGSSSASATTASGSRRGRSRAGSPSGSSGSESGPAISAGAFGSGARPWAAVPHCGADPFGRRGRPEGANGGGSTMIKVLVADDHAVVRRGLRQILAETPDILVGGEAACRAEILRLVSDERWDVVVLDINLQDANGLEILAEIHRDKLLRATGPDSDRVLGGPACARAVRAGAAGFLTKESAPENLIDAVRKVASGGRYVTAALAERLATFVAAKHGGAPHERLSNREFEVMKMIASGKAVGEIARELSLSVKTVKHPPRPTPREDGGEDERGAHPLCGEERPRRMSPPP